METKANISYHATKGADFLAERTGQIPWKNEAQMSAILFMRHTQRKTERMARQREAMTGATIQKKKCAQK